MTNSPNPLLNFADQCQAMEKPAELLADVEEYIKKAWKGADKIIPVR
jgi:hypothetical protein